jgi:hypothetical protein
MVPAEELLVRRRRRFFWCAMHQFGACCLQMVRDLAGRASIVCQPGDIGDGCQSVFFHAHRLLYIKQTNEGRWHCPHCRQ